MKHIHFRAVDLSSGSAKVISNAMANKPGRRSNPIPEHPEEEEEPIKPTKDDPAKKKKKKGTYEVTY